MFLPGLSATSGRLVVSMTLAQTTRLLSSSSETTGFTVLVDWVDDPVDSRIAADSLVLRIDEDDLEVLVGGVLVNPVGVENSQVGAAASDTLFSSRLEGSLVLQLVNTLVGGLAYAEKNISSIPALCSEFDSIPYVAPLGTGRLRPPRRTRTR